MSEFDFFLSDEAKADIRNLDRPVRKRLLDKLEWLGANVLLVVHQPLKGDRWEGAFSGIGLAITVSCISLIMNTVG